MKSLFLCILFYFIIFMHGECQHLKHYTGAYGDYNPSSMFASKATADYFYYKDKNSNKIFQNQYLLEVHDLFVDSLIRMTMRGSFNTNLKDGAWIAIDRDPYLPTPDTLTGHFTNSARTGIWTSSKGIKVTFNNNHLTGSIRYALDRYGSRVTIDYTITDNLLSGIYKNESIDFKTEIRYFKGYKCYTKHTDLTTDSVIYTSIVDTNSIISCINEIEVKKTDQLPLYNYTGKYQDPRMNTYIICYSAYDKKYYKVYQINSFSVLDDVYDLATSFDKERGSEQFILPYMYCIQEYDTK